MIANAARIESRRRRLCGTDRGRFGPGGHGGFVDYAQCTQRTRTSIMMGGSRCGRSVGRGDALLEQFLFMIDLSRIHEHRPTQGYRNLDGARNKPWKPKMSMPHQV